MLWHYHVPTSRQHTLQPARERLRHTPLIAHANRVRSSSSCMFACPRAAAHSPALSTCPITLIALRSKRFHPPPRPLLPLHCKLWCSPSRLSRPPLLRTSGAPSSYTYPIFSYFTLATRQPHPFSCDPKVVHTATGDTTARIGKFNKSRGTGKGTGAVSHTYTEVQRGRMLQRWAGRGSAGDGGGKGRRGRDEGGGGSPFNPFNSHARRSTGHDGHREGEGAASNTAGASASRMTWDRHGRAQPPLSPSPPSLPPSLSPSPVPLALSLSVSTPVSPPSPLPSSGRDVYHTPYHQMQRHDERSRSLQPGGGRGKVAGTSETAGTGFANVSLRSPSTASRGGGGGVGVGALVGVGGVVGRGRSEADGEMSQVLNRQETDELRQLFQLQVSESNEQMNE